MSSENGYDRHNRQVLELLQLVTKHSQENGEGKTLKRISFEWRDNGDGTLSFEGYDASFKYPRKPKSKKICAMKRK